MFTTIRRLVVALAVAAVSMAGAFTVLTSAAAHAATVVTSSGQPVRVNLDQTETTAAAASLAAAENICTTKVMPSALLWHTYEELRFPVCQVALQFCARQADAIDQLAAVTLYAESFVCSTWVQGG